MVKGDPVLTSFNTPALCVMSHCKLMSFLAHIKRTRLIPPLFHTRSMSCHAFQSVLISAYIQLPRISKQPGFEMQPHTRVPITVQYRSLPLHFVISVQICETIQGWEIKTFGLSTAPRDLYSYMQLMLRL